jgi:RNA polymerase sigma-70 factor (ECF subfamily)
MWPGSDETQELLSHAGRGEPDAVDQLLERHRAGLRQAIALRLDRKLSQRVDASDIVQDVLLEASRRMEDYLKRPPMPFSLWLRQLAKDHMIDAHRRHRVAQRRSLDREQPLAKPSFADQSSLDLAGQLCDGELTPAAAAMKQELERRFLAALETMSDDDREIILMRHFEHLTSEQAAEALGLTPAAAGMRHLRALRRLRGILGEKSGT